MSYALNLYHDQITPDGAEGSALAPAHRLVYVRHGTIAINGETMSSDLATYFGDAVIVEGAADWSQVWRWEIAPANEEPNLLAGAGRLSMLRMSRVITTLDLVAGSEWLFRLDRITSAAGRVASRHQHPGPGIRCLLEGTFNVEQPPESVRDRVPGDPWWETGSDTVVAWGSRQMPAKFLRGMVLPSEWESRVTGTWLSGDAPTAPGNWHLYVDQIITL